MEHNKVIDADRGIILEEFPPEKIAEIKNKYENIGKWEDVSIDHEGDLVLWEEV